MAAAVIAAVAVMAAAAGTESTAAGTADIAAGTGIMGGRSSTAAEIMAGTSSTAIGIMAITSITAAGITGIIAIMVGLVRPFMVTATGMVIRTDYNYGPYPYYGAYPTVYRGYIVSDYYALVVSVQKALARRGYYRGPIDGIIGKGTRRAILAYRADHGLRVISRIDNELLRALG